MSEMTYFIEMLGYISNRLAALEKKIDAKGLQEVISGTEDGEAIDEPAPTAEPKKRQRRGAIKADGIFRVYETATGKYLVNKLSGRRTGAMNFGTYDDRETAIKIARKLEKNHNKGGFEK